MFYNLRMLPSFFPYANVIFTIPEPPCPDPPAQHFAQFPRGMYSVRIVHLPGQE